MQLRGHEMSGRVAGFRHCVAALHSVQRGPLCNCSRSDKLSRGREVPGVVLPLCTSSTGLGENTRIAPSASPLRSFKCRRKQSSPSLWSPSRPLARRKPSRHRSSPFRSSRLSLASTSKTVSGQGVALSPLSPVRAGSSPDCFRPQAASFIAVTSRWRYHRAVINRLGEVPTCNTHSFVSPFWRARQPVHWLPARRRRPSRFSPSLSSTTNTATRPAVSVARPASVSIRPIRHPSPIARRRPVRPARPLSRPPLTARSLAFRTTTMTATRALRGVNPAVNPARLLLATDLAAVRTLRAGVELRYRVSFVQEGTQC